jgi:hypothetical protein
MFLRKPVRKRPPTDLLFAWFPQTKLLVEKRWHHVDGEIFR